MAHVAAEQLHHSLYFDNTVIQAFTPKSCGCTLYLHEISDSKWTMLPLSNIIGNFAVKLSEAISGLSLEVTLKQQQTSGTRFLVSTGPGECRSKSTWKACADCWRPEQCTSLFIFRNKAWSPYGLPCYHIWLAWRDGVNILVSSSSMSIVQCMFLIRLHVLCTWPQHWICLQGIVPLVSSEKGIIDNLS